MACGSARKKGSPASSRACRVESVGLQQRPEQALPVLFVWGCRLMSCQNLLLSTRSRRIEFLGGMNAPLSNHGTSDREHAGRDAEATNNVGPSPASYAASSGRGEAERCPHSPSRSDGSKALDHRTHPAAIRSTDWLSQALPRLARAALGSIDLRSRSVGLRLRNSPKPISAMACIQTPPSAASHRSPPLHAHKHHDPRTHLHTRTHKPQTTQVDSCLGSVGGGQGLGSTRASSSPLA